MIERFDQSGFVVVRGLAPPALRKALRAEAEAMAEPGWPPLLMPHRSSALFQAMLEDPRFWRIADELICGSAAGSLPRISALGSEFFFHPPGARGFSLHQDNLWLKAPPGQFLHCWTALEPCGRENGCMVFYPGSHRLGLLEPAQINEEAGPGQNPTARRTALPEPEGIAPFLVELDAGDTVFFHNLLVHGSLNNLSARFRRSLLLTYLRKGAPFEPGQRQKRVEIEIRV